MRRVDNRVPKTFNFGTLFLIKKTLTKLTNFKDDFREVFGTLYFEFKYSDIRTKER